MVSLRPSAAGTIRCRHCGEPIVSREEMLVVGQTLAPIHVGCRAEFDAGRPWYLRPSWPVNRWSSVLRFNGILLALILGLHFTIAPLPDDAWGGLAVILALANGSHLLARLVSYFGIERHVPSRRVVERG